MAVLKEYDESKQQWQGVGAGYIANPDGSNKFTPDELRQYLNYATASGTNTYTATISGIGSLVEGMTVKIKFTNANTGASTLNINGLGAKAIQKANGSGLSAGNIKAGQVCHLVYTGSVFQLLGEGGEYGNVTPDDVIKGVTFGTEEGLKTGTLELTGNAAASQVLTGRTFYTINPKSKQTGTMPNRGAVNQTLTTQGGAYRIPEGYHDGTGTVKAQFANLIASNIKSGVNVGGVVGTYSGTLGRSTYFNEDKVLGGETRTRTITSLAKGNVIYYGFRASGNYDLEIGLLNRGNTKTLRSGTYNTATLEFRTNGRVEYKSVYPGTHQGAYDYITVFYIY